VSGIKVSLIKIKQDKEKCNYPKERTSLDKAVGRKDLKVNI
jgi:hypothetical protein